MIPHGRTHHWTGQRRPRDTVLSGAGMARGMAKGAALKAMKKVPPMKAMKKIPVDDHWAPYVRQAFATVSAEPQSA